jgi:hypothetical protein
MFRRERFQSIPNDVFQIFTLSLLTEVAYHEQDLESARYLLQRLNPYRGKMVVFSWGSLLAGSVSYFLGLLKLLLDEASEAETLFNEAISAEKRFGAYALVARTNLALACALARRATRERNEEHAREVRCAGLRAYADLGLATPYIFRESPSNGIDGPTSQGEEVNRMERSGDYWTITFRSKSVRLRNAKGLEYICTLVRHQGHGVSSLTLTRNELGVTGREVAVIEGLSTVESPTMGEPPIDRIAGKEYAARLKSLSEQLSVARQNNDQGVIDAIESEVRWVESELHGARGRGNSSHDLATERARVNVRNNISGLLKRIHRHHPLLGRHLDASIKTGRFCEYRPETPTRWEIIAG